MFYFAAAVFYLSAFAAATYLTMHGYWGMGLCCLALIGGTSFSRETK